MNLISWKEQLESMSDEQLNAEIARMEKNVKFLRYESEYYAHVLALIAVEQDRRAGR